MNWLAEKIEQWPTARLLPYARNARTHSDEQVAQIAASIAEFGFTNPILAGSDGIIVAGHGRLAAAQKLGLEIVPVVVLDHLTQTQRRALVIADNRIAENAGWDDAMLRIELEALNLEGFDLDITGFDADALAELIAGDEADNASQSDEDAVPEVGETPISRPGDVWVMGSYQLAPLLCIMCLPGRECKCYSRSCICGNHMNFGVPAAARFADGLWAVFLEHQRRRDAP